jgi:hypothetical protein
MKAARLRRRLPDHEVRADDLNVDGGLTLRLVFGVQKPLCRPGALAKSNEHDCLNVSGTREP